MKQCKIRTSILDVFPIIMNHFTWIYVKTLNNYIYNNTALFFSLWHRITYVWSEIGNKHRIYETRNLGHCVGYSKHRTSIRSRYIGMWKIESTADRNLMNSHWCCKHYDVSGDVVCSQKIQAVQAEAWRNKTWSIELYNQNKLWFVIT